jgi:rhamnose utilization protein RhaD (predicted bifunctional aldolase and dehydrogenase)
MSKPHATPSDLADLADFSARIGADPMLIQAAGGNTSVKDTDVMWIKASGTQLAEAMSKDIFVPVDLAALRDGIDDPGVDADQTAQFALSDSPLRSSIETSLHAVFAQRVVVHVHCVNTLAFAVRADAEAQLQEKLADFDWCLVPYARPGAFLAAEVRRRLGARTNVAVLANHGLILAGDSVHEVAQLLNQVVRALRLTPAPRRDPDLAALSALAGADWRVPSAEAAMHQLALSPARLEHAIAGSLYPDHVIFCGIAATACSAPPDAPDAPPFVLIPDRGALLRNTATESAIAMANCLGDVLLRVPGEATLSYLSADQNAELLDWDAEKYRQKLNA